MTSSTSTERGVAVPDADPLALGVKRARPLRRGSVLPQYVPRDKDTELIRAVKRASRGQMVVLIGDSTAGKSRSMFEAMVRTFPERVVFAPSAGADLGHLYADLHAAAPAVLWLDDLDGYLGPGGLDPPLLSSLTRLGTAVLATMHAGRYLDYLTVASSVPSPHSGHIGARVLNMVREVIRLPRLWEKTELDRASRVDDPRLHEASEHPDTIGVAEYLAAAPALWQTWQWASGSPGHPRGAALVTAAVDLARAGVNLPISRYLLELLHGEYLQLARGAALQPESLEQAWEWATMERFGVTGLLMRGPAAAWRPFDYLVTTAAADHAIPPVKDVVWNLALEHTVNDTVRFSIGVAASAQDRHDIGEAAFRPLGEAGNADAAINMAVLRYVAGVTDESQDWYRRAAEANNVSAANSVGVLSDDVDDEDDAEAWYRSAAEAGDIDAAYNLGVLLSQQGRHLEAAHWWHHAAASGDTDAAFNLQLPPERRKHQIHFRKADTVLRMQGRPDGAN